MKILEEVIFNIRPVPKPRMTRADKWKKRPVVEKYYSFKDNLNLQADLMNFKLPHKLSIDFHIEMPISWSKKRKEELLGKPHQNKPDIDNLGKAFLDALVCEDMEVYDLHLRKFWNNENLIIVRYEKADGSK